MSTHAILPLVRLAGVDFAARFRAKFSGGS